MAMTSPLSHRRRSRRITGLILTALFVVVVGWCTGFYQFTQNSIPDHIDDNVTRTDAIVVLTGGSGRLDVGLDLLVRNFAHRLFVSGVYQGIDVNQLLKMFRENPGGLSSRVEIGNAIDTRGNAVETAVWAHERKIESVRLVTAAYHMPRSLLEFSYRMPGIQLIPHPVFPEHVKEDWWLWPGTAWLMTKEYNKYVVVQITRQAMLLFGRPLQGKVNE
ncbi:MAG: YdcF family protein [Rhodospirillales bacterium]|jgi:uncharacterized SAM-binding protein YcdF (DUF218 family)|nr:YdcF family protein [Rhodospirillales bacterium]